MTSVRLFKPEVLVYDAVAHEGQWLLGHVHCFGCLNTWWAVFPAEADALDCPRCYCSTMLPRVVTEGRRR